LKPSSVVDAIFIAALNSTKNNSGTRDPEVHQTKKGNQWHFETKVHIGGDAESGLVPTLNGTARHGTAANVHDIVEAYDFLQVQEILASGDSGDLGIHKREEANEEVKSNVQ
jgi:transposase, IS5 family